MGPLFVLWDPSLPLGGRVFGFLWVAGGQLSVEVADILVKDADIFKNSLI